MKILFICKHNRFRSKVGEAIFKQIIHNNKLKGFKIKSAGTNPDYLPVAENVQKALQELGYKKANRFAKKLKQDLIDWAEIIILVADNVNLNNYNTKGKKIIVWKVSDTSQNDYKGIIRRIKNIEKKIKTLIKSLI